MKKALVVALLILLCLPFMAFAAQYHSLPVGHEAYRMIDAAEIRGIIPVLTDVKPYNVNLVRDILNKILESDKFSSSEKNQVNRVLTELDSSYGNETTDGLSDLFKRGYLRSSVLNTTTIGGKASFDFTMGKESVEDADKVIDARISGMAYINGDLFDFMSYDLNFKLNLDRIDVRAAIPTDLKINCDGFYMNIFAAEDGSDRLTELPDPNKWFYLGIEHFSEISMSFKEEMFSARIGTVPRDWGPGYNNIGLAGSARAFDGFEISFKPASWFNYSVIVGSLGLMSLDSVNGVEWPSENMDVKDGMYYNNISMHRVELGIPMNMTFLVGIPVSMRFGIWESVIWRKRMELSYLSPLSIYMFAQNALGDYDNVLAGFDMTVTIEGIGQFYAALSMDELNNFKLFANPRNILAYQIGARFSPRILDFSELTVQATYIPAFYGSHYVKAGSRIFEDLPYNGSYVNKGQNLGYPVNPDTIELLLDLHTSFGSGWTVGLTVKDQLRSAQYSYKTTGTDMLTYMSYEAYYAEEYYDRNILDNIWNKEIQAKAVVEKSFSGFPLTVSLGITGIWDRTRPFEPTVRVREVTYNPGIVEFTGDWVNTFTLNGSFGARIYY